ncbi:MAG: hypothetical protein QXZ02_07220 [Candidatus Bathyarchaeia archaeon]
MVNASKESKAIRRKKEKMSNIVHSDASLQKWLFTNRNKTSDTKSGQKKEESSQLSTTRHNADMSDVANAETKNTMLGKLLSLIELMCKRPDLLEHSVQKIGHKNGTFAIKYRKNRRVMYIPKTGIYEEVLKRLREHENEELKITIEKVFQKAAKQLGLLNEN